jgi:hypothetical protein
MICDLSVSSPLSHILILLSIRLSTILIPTLYFVHPFSPYISSLSFQPPFSSTSLLHSFESLITWFRPWHELFHLVLWKSSKPITILQSSTTAPYRVIILSAFLTGKFDDPVSTGVREIICMAMSLHSRMALNSV